MPCRDYYDDHPAPDLHGAELAVVGPALCAILRALAKEKGLLMEGLLNQVDWRQAGVTKKEVLDWWKKHEEQDRIYQEEKARRAAEKKAKKAALEKLTPEERKLLGVG
jgi:hypothetical protein